MSVNFSVGKCQQYCDESEFGICDKGNKTPAYIDIINKSTWITEVHNYGKINVLFTAIDHCVEIFRANGEQESRCDCMLTYANTIIFIELKERESNWLEDGINQIDITIDKYKENNNIGNFKVKRAYLSNRKKPNFNFSNSEQKEKFKDKTGFQLFVRTLIVI